MYRITIILLFLACFDQLNGQIIQEVHNEKGTQFAHSPNESEYNALMELFKARPLTVIYDDIEDCLKNHSLSTNKNRFKVNDLRNFAEKYHAKLFEGRKLGKIKEADLIKELQALYK